MWKFWKKPETDEERVLRYEREWEVHVAKSRKSKEGGNDYRAMLEMGYAVQKAIKHQQLVHDIQAAKEAAILENKTKVKKYHAKKKAERMAAAKAVHVMTPMNEIMKPITARAEREAALKAATKKKMSMACGENPDRKMDANEEPLKNCEQVDDNIFERIWSEADDFDSKLVNKTVVDAVMNKTQEAPNHLNK